MDVIGLFFGILVIGFMIHVFIKVVIEPMSIQAKEPCKVHKWTRDTNDNMFCKECGKRPSYESRGHDE